MEPAESEQSSEVTSFQRERYHAIQSFDLTIWILFIYLWFLDNSTWALFARIIMQTAFCNQSTTTSEPSSISLASSLFGVIFINSILLISHSTTNVKGLLKSKSIFIDFVSKESPPSNLHLIAMDLLLMMIQSLLILLVDGTNRADLQKDDWRGDIDGVQVEQSTQTSKRNQMEGDLESGIVEESLESDDEDERHLIFDSEDLHEGTSPNQRAEEGEEGTQESSPFLDPNPSNSDSSTLRNRKRNPRNRQERSAYSEPIAVLSFSRTLSIFKSIMKNQMPEEEATSTEGTTNGNEGESSTPQGASEPSRVNPELRNDRDLEAENRIRIRRELRDWSLEQRNRNRDE